MKTKPNLQPSRSMRTLVKVRVVWSRNGAKMWLAKCSASRCKFAEPHLTHNGARMAAARHRREKALTKLHGAREVSV